MHDDAFARDRRVQAVIDLALAEDVGKCDVTTLSLVPAATRIRASVLTREACRVAGGGIAARVFETVDSAIRSQIRIPDGQDAQAGEVILDLSGPAQGILIAERTALNLMQRLCGIATCTARFVEAVKPWGTRILDTRKTTPGLRLLEKYAVRCGGGENHRMGLYDRVLIKDNHRRLWQGGDPDRLDLAVEAARQRFPGIPVEVEVETLTELRSALRARPEWVLLDNMSAADRRACVALARGISLTEASGGITLESVAEVAATGVDALSLGCLTHSVRSIDLSLEWTATESSDDED